MSKLLVALVLAVCFTACGFEKDNAAVPVPNNVCVPQCAGMQCGNDGCGNQCGVCKDNESCDDGICVAQPVEVNPEVVEEATTPETTPEVCVPDCADKVCGGSNGCGGKCLGECSGINETCNLISYKCECVPQCDNKSCGDDGCGGVCGKCASTACISGQCESGACVFAPVVCNDHDVTTTDTCDAVTGGCVYQPKVCDDDNACTVDSLDAQGNCGYTQKSCDDDNACTTDTCDPIRGCVFTAVVCNDGDLCTVDFCDSLTGCMVTSKSCDDGDPCTDDVCDKNKGCVSTSKSCDDGSLCTTDSCDKVSGECVFAPVVCDDDKNYTDDSCNPATGGCEYVVKDGSCLKDSDCEDGNGCTKDVCDSITNHCKSVEVLCDDNNPCTTVEKCVPAQVEFYGYECVAVEWKFCDDNNACTWDYCDGSTGACSYEQVVGCCNTDADCGGYDYCQMGSCTAVKCPPQPECWSYYVGDHQCNAIMLNAGEMCSFGECDGYGSCVQCLSDADCNDNNATTEDTCKVNTCFYTPTSCDDGDKMTEDWFDPISGTCFHSTQAFSVWCTIPAVWQATGRWCEVWVSFGGNGEGNLQQDMAYFKENGEKVSAKLLCNSWWYPYQAEFNVRVFGPGIDPNTAPWVGGSYAQIADPAGVKVALVTTGHGYQETPNWGTPTTGIPWCK